MTESEIQQGAIAATEKRIQDVESILSKINIEITQLNAGREETLGDDMRQKITNDAITRTDVIIFPIPELIIRAETD